MLHRSDISKLWWGILLLVIWLNARASFAVQDQSSTKAEARQTTFVGQLEVGGVIEQELTGNETHAYGLTLVSGQYVRVAVRQRGIDVLVTLRGPDGQQITDVDSVDGAQGPEPISIVAERSGTYSLEVRLKQDVAPGHYQVRIEQLRQSVPQDKDRISAERAFNLAERLQMQGTADSLKKATEKYEEALVRLRALGDHNREASALNHSGLAFSKLGQNRKALSYYRQAFALWHSLGDRGREAYALHNMGALYNSLGDKRKAIKLLNQALLLMRASRDKRG